MTRDVFCPFTANATSTSGRQNRNNREVINSVLPKPGMFTSVPASTRIVIVTLKSLSVGSFMPCLGNSSPGSLWSFEGPD